MVTQTDVERKGMEDGLRANAGEEKKRKVAEDTQR
jgi:hypothetical protein